VLIVAKFLPNWPPTM